MGFQKACYKYSFFLLINAGFNAFLVEYFGWHFKLKNKDFCTLGYLKI